MKRAFCLLIAFILQLPQAFGAQDSVWLILTTTGRDAEGASLASRFEITPGWPRQVAGQLHAGHRSGLQ
jgi:hypothetical protein